MAYLRKLALAAIAGIASTAAQAADMPIPAPAVVDYGGWYLRGDIGITNQAVKRLDSPAFTSTVTVLEKGFDSSGSVDVGIGYQFNSWIRTDFTAEYRSKANFNGLDFVSAPVVQTNQYRGDKSEWLFLFNAYVDLGTWYSITPFVGAGVGFDRLTIGNFTDTNISAPALGWSPDNSKWNFAWALYAGAAYQVTPNFTIELSYRYVNLGNGATKDLLAPDGSNPTVNPIQFKNVYSNDIRIGARWMFAGYGSEPEPLIRKY